MATGQFGVPLISVWRTLKKRMNQILYNKETPEEIRKYNRKILAEINTGGLFTNVGERSLEHTNPRCGFCSQICVADFNQRKELYALLQASGKLYVDTEGKEYVKRSDNSLYYPPTDLQ